MAAGIPYLTFATSLGNLSTDIPQDFAIQLPQQPPAATTNISIRVPPGAAYLFVSAKDKHFSDNIDNATNHFRLLLDRALKALLTVNLASSSLGERLAVYGQQPMVSGAIFAVAVKRLDQPWAATFRNGISAWHRSNSIFG